MPNIFRNAIINAAELATYDEVKQLLFMAGFMDNPGTHCFAAFVTGFFVAFIGSPLDVVRTRILHGALEPSGGFYYQGMVHCFLKMFYEEGVGSFYNGFLLTYLRIGSWNTIMFMTLEQIRKIVQPRRKYH